MIYLHVRQKMTSLFSWLWANAEAEDGNSLGIRGWLAISAGSVPGFSSMFLLEKNLAWLENNQLNSNRDDTAGTAPAV